jgi:hypothetical protein
MYGFRTNHADIESLEGRQTVKNLQVLLKPWVNGVSHESARKQRVQVGHTDSKTYIPTYSDPMVMPRR